MGRIGQRGLPLESIFRKRDHVPQDQGHPHGDDHDHGMDQGGAEGEETQEEAPQAQNDDDGESIQPQHQVSHPRVHQSIQRDHPVDNIPGSI